MKRASVCGSESVSSVWPAGKFFLVAVMAALVAGLVSCKDGLVPKGVADVYVTFVNTPLIVTVDKGILANDETNFCEIVSPATDAAVTTTQGGSLTLMPDGSFSYYPPSAVFAGEDSFSYTLGDAKESVTMTVTIIVGITPVAANDDYTTTVDTPIAVNAGAGPPADLLQNDTLGTPTATIVSFGGGDLGGTAGDHAAGRTVTVGASGSLVVHADGSFAYTPDAGFTGNFAFQYRLQNITGAVDGTVTIGIPNAPSTIADTYRTSTNATLTVAVGAGPPADLLQNDDLGVPAATITSFGSGSLGGSVTDHAAGNTAMVGGAGSLSIAADGSFTFTPDTNFTGTFTVEYRLENASGVSSDIITIEVQDAPVANADAYSTAMNVPLNVAVGAGPPADVLQNDVGSTALASFGGGDLDGTAADHAAGSTVILGGTGSLTVRADGSFDFVPVTGFTGAFTFEYRISNDFGFEDALVTIDVNGPPAAVNDGTYNLLIDTTASVSIGNGLLANDSRGWPLGTVSSFGAGDLGGIVTTNAAGSSVALAGGMLQVNADGSLTITNATTPGTYTFDYRASNSEGNSDATVTLLLGEAPVAVRDPLPVLTGTSTPGSSVHHVALNTTATLSAGTDGLLDNDSLGSPTAAILGFGGVDLGGTILDHAAGSTVSPIPGFADGSLTVNADGSVSFAPPTDFTGTLTFMYRVGNVFGESDALVVFAVGNRMAATADALTVTGNVVTDTAVGPTLSVLANDTGDALTITAFDATTTGNGTIAMNTTTGEFTYTPVTGYRGDDTFTYTVANGFGSAVVTVTLTVDPLVWFIDNSAASNGDGSQNSPFDSIANFVAANVDVTTDIIYLHTGSGAYAGPLTLKDSQQIIGEGAALTVNGFTIRPAGTRPTMGAADATAITLAQDNTLRGFDIGDTGTGTGLFSNAFLGTITIDTMAIGGTGEALDFSNAGGTYAITLDSLSSTDSADTGMSIFANFTGSFTVTGATTITNPAGRGINIQNGFSAGSATFGDITINGRNSIGIRLVGGGGAPTIVMGNVTLGALTSGTGVGLLLYRPRDLTIGNVVIEDSGNYGISLELLEAGNSATFGDVTLNNATTSAGIRIFNSTGGTATFGNVTSRSLANGIQFESNTGGSFTFVSTTVLAATTGIFVDTTTGATANFGATAISGANTGVDIGASGTSDFTFASLNVTATNGDALSVTTANSLTVNGATNDLTATNGSALYLEDVTTLACTFQTPTSTSSTDYGVYVDSCGGAITITGTTTVDSANNTSVVIRSSASGSTTTFADIVINGRKSGGLVVNGTQGAVVLGNVTVNAKTTGTPSGVYMQGASDVTVGDIFVQDSYAELLYFRSFNNAAYTVTTGNITTGSASSVSDSLKIDNSAGGTFTFGAVSVATNDTGSAGLRLHNNSGGSVTCDSVTVTSGKGGISVTSSGMSADFGNVAISGVDIGVNLDTATGTYTFDSLNVTATNGAAIIGTTVGTLTVNGATNDLSATSGAAISLTTVTTLAATVRNISSTNSADYGVRLNTVGGSLTVSGTTTITNPTGDGISIANAPSGSTATFGGITVDSRQDRGVEISSHAGTFTSGDITIGAHNSSPDYGINFGTVSGTISTGNITIADGAQALMVIASTQTTANITVGNVTMTNGNNSGLYIDNVQGSAVITIGDVTTTNATNLAGLTFTNISGGTMTVANATLGASNAAYNALVLTNCTGGAVTFTSVNAFDGRRGLRMQDVAGMTIDFGNFTVAGAGIGQYGIVMFTCTSTVTFDSLSITAPQGIQLSATTGVSINGAANSVTATSGPAFNFSNSTAGVGGLNFATVSATGGTQGIYLNAFSGTLAITGSLTVTNPTTAGIEIDSSPSATVSIHNPTISMNATGVANHGIDLTAMGGGSFSITSDSDAAGIFFTNSGNAAGIAAIDLDTFSVTGTAADLFTIDGVGLGTDDSNSPTGIYVRGCISTTIDYVMFTTIGETTTAGLECAIYAYLNNAAATDFTVTNCTTSEVKDGSSVYVYIDAGAPTIMITDNLFGVVTGQAPGEFTVVVGVVGTINGPDISIQTNSILSQGSSETGGAILVGAYNGAGSNSPVRARVGGYGGGVGNTISDRMGTGIEFICQSGAVMLAQATDNILAFNSGNAGENSAVTGTCDGALGEASKLDLTSDNNIVIGYNRAGTSPFHVTMSGNSQSSEIRLTIGNNNLSSLDAATPGIYLESSADTNAGSGTFDAYILEDLTGTNGLQQVFSGTNQSKMRLNVLSCTTPNISLMRDSGTGETDLLQIGDLNSVPVSPASDGQIQAVIDDGGSNANTVSGSVTISASVSSPADIITWTTIQIPTTP